MYAVFNETNFHLYSWYPSEEEATKVAATLMHNHPSQEYSILTESDYLKYMAEEEGIDCYDNNDMY